MARNTDDRQVWDPAEDPDAPRWEEYGYAGGKAALAEAGGLAADPARRDTGRTLRVVALVGAILGLAGLTVAACVLSYSSMHHLAIQAGVSARLASVYPWIFDALLVVAGCSVLALRGAGLVSRIYGWLSMLVLLGCLAAGGAIRAAAVSVPRHVAGVVAAIVPWALVLIGFGLLLTLLRYARVRRAGGSGHYDDLEDRASAVAALEGGYEGATATDSADGAATDPAESTGNEQDASPDVRAVQASELNPAPVMNPAPLTNPAPVMNPAPVLNPAPVMNPAPTSDDDGDDVPAFRRTRSSPTPPGE